MVLVVGLGVVQGLEISKIGSHFGRFEASKWSRGVDGGGTFRRGWAIQK